VKTDEIWKNIHGERIQLVDTLNALSAEQWETASWCEGWSVQQTVGHVGAAKRLALLGPKELVRRLQARTTTTNHPPAPVMAMLGEIVVHGQDIRRPLGLEHKSPAGALVALADSWKKTNLLIGAKRRIAGLKLRATDNDWTYGDGPEVSGPLISLIMGMTGRNGAYADLEGEGLETLRNRA
jgi:hypothetical protein